MKKLIRWALLAVVVIWVIQDPASAASFAHAVMSGLSRAGQSLSALSRGIG